MILGGYMLPVSWRVLIYVVDEESGGPAEENVDRLVRYKNPYDMARGGGSKASSSSLPLPTQSQIQRTVPASLKNLLATMKLSLALLPSLLGLALALPGSLLNARLACPATQPGCTTLGNCEYCCPGVPADTECHIHEPIESCGTAGGVVYHCQPH
ncbi:hypothetical protein BDV12DRAFT_205178 [Aspergillus spectabilis]